MLTLDHFREARQLGLVWGRDRAREAPTYGAFLVEHCLVGAAEVIVGRPGRDAEIVAHFICRVARRTFQALTAVPPTHASAESEFFALFDHPDEAEEFVEMAAHEHMVPEGEERWPWLLHFATQNTPVG